MKSDLISRPALPAPSLECVQELHAFPCPPASPPAPQIARRGILLAGAAAALALGAAANAAAIVTANGAAARDPIFAAIEAHRAALLIHMEASRLEGYLEDDTPEHDAARERANATSDVEDDAAFDLVTIQPTTLPGVLALLAYADDLCVGRIALPHDPEWSWTHENLPEWSDGEVDPFSGEPLERPFLFWLLRNVRKALEAISVRS